MRKVIVFMMVVLVAISFAFAGGASDGAKVIKVAHYYAESHPLNIALNEIFKPMVEEESGGRFQVQIYPNNTLGAEKEFMEATKLGTVEMCIAGNTISDQFPKFKIINFPWVFSDIDLSYAVLSDPDIQHSIFDDALSVNMVGKGFVLNGVRAVSNNVRPINTVADCKGIKLRLPEVSQFVDNGHALGFNVVTMSMSEIFTALQQGVIDGQENPPTTLLTSGWYEVQKYLSMTNHQITYDWIAFSKQFWDSLTPEDQALLEKACKAFADAEVEMYKEGEASDIQKLKDNGVTVNEISEENMVEFRAVGDSVIQKYADELPEFNEILTQVRAKEAEILASK